MSGWLGEIKCPKCGAWLIPCNYCSNCGHSFKKNNQFYSDTTTVKYSKLGVYLEPIGTHESDPFEKEKNEKD